MTKISVGLLLVFVVVVFYPVESRDVAKPSQHKRSLNQSNTKLNDDNVDAKPVRYNFYGGKKRMFLPINKIDIKKLLGEARLLSKRNRKQRKKFEKKSNFFVMHPSLKKLKNNHPKVKNGYPGQSWKTSIEKAFRKDSLVDLLQAFKKTNTSQSKRNNKTEVSSKETENVKAENPKTLLHEVLENADQKQSSVKIATEEIKLGLGKIVSQLKNVLKQDSDFLKSTSKERQTKKVDLKKLIADIKASQNNTSNEENDESIVLSPQQKLKVSDLQISKDLNLKEKSGEQNGGQGMGINGMNGMNVMGGMNGMNVMNMNAMNGMNGMALPNGVNGGHGMEINGMNGMIGMNGINGMNGMNGMNVMGGMDGINMNAMNGMDGMALPNGMNGMNGMGAMNGFPAMNSFNGMNTNPAIAINNLPRMSEVNSDVPDGTQMQNIMYNRFNGEQMEPNNWLPDSRGFHHPPLERYQYEHEDEDEPEETPQYHHYPRHRARYYSPYEDEISEDVRGVPQRYRGEEEEEEDEDRAQLGEYENADERDTITRRVHLRKHRFHHHPTQKKSTIKRPEHKTRSKVANRKASDIKGHGKPVKNALYKKQ